MSFGDHMERDDYGLLTFPNDKKFRDTIGFIPESFEHPAKANLHLVFALINYCSNPGDRIMDITAGSGSILMAVELGRHVTCIELNPQFVGWMRESASRMQIDADRYLILQGDCRDYLPLSCNAIIFSPPYSNLLQGGGILKRERIGQDIAAYANEEAITTNPKNLASLPEFRFSQAMRGIYKQCWDSLPTGGMLALIIKDIMRQQKVIPVGWHHVQMLGQDGWELDSWVQWAAPGMQFKNIHRSQGHKVIEGEHIIIVRRPR
jgi:DNA modification methylase